jgi:NADP-dependent 3-hydroxy acid dehydrogenase YdfG
VVELEGKIGWVTGAGSGIGEAAALALAHEGMRLVLTGRREEPLQRVAERVRAAGGTAEVEPADLTKSSRVEAIAAQIRNAHGRLDVLVNNAGTNIPERAWRALRPEGIDALIATNLTSAFYVVRAVLPMMRAQQDGLLIHTASWAGRFVGPVSGPAYVAAKHGMVAMSHSINLEECTNGIRSCVICPGEVATPIMAFRSPPESPQALARMLQPEDMGRLVAFIAKQPRHVCINEILISPTHNRGYIGAMQARAANIAAARAS